MLLLQRKLCHHFLYCFIFLPHLFDRSSDTAPKIEIDLSSILNPLRVIGSGLDTAAWKQFDPISIFRICTSCSLDRLPTSGYWWFRGCLANCACLLPSFRSSCPCNIDR
jgi:hypothetical protein